MADEATSGGPGAASPKGYERADQSVSTRFSRVMRATTSPYGVLTDPPLVALVTAVLVVVALVALRAGVSETVGRILVVVAALPLATATATTLALSGARRRVVGWLAGLPFPVENMNAVLNGVGEGLEVVFADAAPKAADLNPELDAVHPDSFVTRAEEGESAVEIRIGVVDSKRNPAASNHARYARVQAIVERVLLPLHAKRRIVEVRVK